MSEIDSKQIFNEFIQFAYNEVREDGWRDRMDILCGENVSILCEQSHRSKTLQEIAEDKEEWNYELMLTITFKELALEEYWFKSWFEQTYPEQEWSWDLRDEFRWYLLGVSYEELLEIFEMGLFCLK
jgi:hypothetical protein